MPLTPSEEGIDYAHLDIEDEKNAPEEGHDDDNRISDSRYNVSLVDNAELLKKLGIIQIEAQKKVPSTGYVHACVLSTRDASTSYLNTNSELETSLLERDQGHEGESVQAVASCENPYVETGVMLL